LAIITISIYFAVNASKMRIADFAFIAVRIRLTASWYRSVLTYIAHAGVRCADIPIITVSIAARIFVNAATKISIPAILLALRAAARQN
jgi:hypothetical protein